MQAIVISGSRMLGGQSGQSGRAGEALAAGLESEHVDVGRIVLPECHIERCRQCNDDGWGICRHKPECIIQDGLANVVEQLKAAEVAIFVTPVYYGDLSESMKAFLDRLRRICSFEESRPGIDGKPTVGVAVAGGGGGGSVRCSMLLGQTLTQIGLDVVDLVPVRRQNLDVKCKQLRIVGRWLAGKPTS
ncbi:MAG: hypothetical protein GVY16_10945 [Planctomycetes bacterium]|jgi:multimeric flavodoxin WrbA|nr:hypothetical protein [Planctomycetota bacterium]